MDRYLARDGLPLCHVRLFGGLEVSRRRSDRSGKRDWRKRKARLLFAMLATKRGHDVPRDQVFEYLWPDMDEERAKNNLYVVWSTMKSVLGGTPKGALRVPTSRALAGCVARFATTSDQTRRVRGGLARAHERGVADRASDALLEPTSSIAEPVSRRSCCLATSTTTGSPASRSHYRSNFVDAMLRASQLLMMRGRPWERARLRSTCNPDGLRCARTSTRCALRCQIAAGQRSSAIDTYFQCRDRLAEELGLDPSAETRALYDQILAMEDRPVPIPLDPFSA